MQIGLVSIILILIKVQLFSYLALFEPITIRTINKTLLIMKLFLGSYKMKQTTGRRDCNRNICLNQTVYTTVMHTLVIAKILNLYIILFMYSLVCTHLYPLFPLSIHSLQCIHCLVQLYLNIKFAE